MVSRIAELRALPLKFILEYESVPWQSSKYSICWIAVSDMEKVLPSINIQNACDFYGFPKFKIFWFNPYWQILENSSRNFPEISVYRMWQRPISGKIIQIWTISPEIGLGHAPIFYKTWISNHKNWWMSFPEIGLCHARKTEISGKFLDEFSRICE